MMDRGRAIMSAPYPPKYRASGVLLHVTSLPSRHGIDTRAWFEALLDQQRQNMWNCLKRHTGVSGDVAPALIQLAWGSAAGLAITPLQDLLNLGSDARMNRPGQAEGNWQWRCTAATLTPVVWRWLRDLTLASDRALVVAQNPGPT